MTNTKTDYDIQAEQFLENTQTSFNAEFLKNDKYFTDDKETRDIYKITLRRGTRSYSFNFGQSLKDSTRYLDKLTGNIFSPSGIGLNCRRKVVHPQFFKDHCKKVGGEPPSAYDVLTAIQKYDVGTFENFCSDFGYDTDSRKAEKVYKAVVDEYKNVCMLWNEKEIEQLQEIQ